MQVRDAMTTSVLELGPDHTLRQAARLMSDRRVGSAIVTDSDSAGAGIITERDILNALAKNLDPDTERTGAHMVRGGFRHLVVMGDEGVLGVISVRDILKAWVPAAVA
jgi:CBS domain-containing protein